MAVFADVFVRCLLEWGVYVLHLANNIFHHSHELLVDCVIRCESVLLVIVVYASFVYVTQFVDYRLNLCCSFVDGEPCIAVKEQLQDCMWALETFVGVEQLLNAFERC